MFLHVTASVHFNSIWVKYNSTGRVSKGWGQAHEDNELGKYALISFKDTYKYRLLKKHQR